jgi:hypothetical protein
MLLRQWAIFGCGVSLPVNDLKYGRRAHSIFSAKPFHCALIGGKALTYFVCLFLGQLGKMMRRPSAKGAKHIPGMGYVLFRGTPLKIIGTIVFLVPIQVVDLFVERLTRAECMRHKSMQFFDLHFPIFTQEDHLVAFFVACAPDEPWAPTAVPEPTDSAKIANLIVKIRNRNPSLTLNRKELGHTFS